MGRGTEPWCRVEGDPPGGCLSVPPGGTGGPNGRRIKCCEMLRFALCFFLSLLSDVSWNQSLLVTCVNKQAPQILEQITAFNSKAAVSTSAGLSVSPWGRGVRLPPCSR